MKNKITRFLREIVLRPLYPRLSACPPDARPNTACCCGELHYRRGACCWGTGQSKHLEISNVRTMIYYWLLIKLTRVPGATGAGQFLVQNTWIRCTSLVASASATSVAGASTSASASGPSRDSASASTSTSTASPASVLEQVLDFFQLVGVLLDGRLQGMLGAALGACITGPHLEDSLQKVMKTRNKISTISPHSCHSLQRPPILTRPLL